MKEKELNNHIVELIEIKLNQWANTVCHRYKINRNSFRITVKQHVRPKSTKYGYLIQDGSYDDWMKTGDTVVRPKKTYIESNPSFVPNQVLAQVTNGPVVQVTLFVPLMSQEGDFAENLKKTILRMKSTIKGLFKYLGNPRLHRDDELFNPMIIGDTLHEYSITSDKAKIWKKKKFDSQVYNGHKKNEFTIEIKREIIVTHRETLIDHIIVDHDNVRTSWDIVEEALDKCSMNVNKSMELIEESGEVKYLVPMSYYEYGQTISNQVRNENV